jgi:hypothetical protein
MNSVHELLPWYVNGTLGVEESGMFKNHLAACVACGSELVILEEMKAELEKHGEDLLADHPPVEQLVAAVTPDGESDGELTGERMQEIRRHLALCVTCGQEASWVLKKVAAEGRVETMAVPQQVTAGRRLLNFALPLAAGFLLAAFLLPLILPGGEGTGLTGLLKPGYVPAAQRAGGEPETIHVPAGVEMIPLIFPVDMAPDAFPLRFEIENSAGQAVYAADLGGAGELYRGALLMVGCRRQDCPDGSYTARLTSKLITELPSEYPFRITATPQGP